jgi:obg-like ATPase 1
MERNLTSDERSQVKAKEEAAAKIREEKVKKEARGASALAKVFGIKNGKVDAERKLMLHNHRNNIRAAIIGLPNSGKSQLFNVLTDGNVPVDGAVFTTHRPNFGRTLLVDPRFDWLEQHFRPRSTARTFLRVTDCPGIIRNSWRAAGIGGDFMKHAGKCDALYVVVRAFDSQQVTHVMNTVNPMRDIDLLIDEMVKFDLQDVRLEANRMGKLVEARAGGSQLSAEYKAIQRIQKFLLEENKPLRFGSWEDQDVALVQRLQLLTAKEPVYVLNMNIRDYLRFEFHEQPSSIVSRVRAHIETRHGGGMILPYSGEFEQRLLDIRRDGAGSSGRLFSDPPPSVPSGVAMMVAPTLPIAASAASAGLSVGMGEDNDVGKDEDDEGGGDDDSDNEEGDDERDSSGREGGRRQNNTPPASPPPALELSKCNAVTNMDAGDAAVAAYLRDNQTHGSAKKALVAGAFKVLRLGQFFTAGPDELRSWTVPRDTHAPAAAGFIHRDFEADFMSVEVQSFLDLRDLGDEREVASQGKLTQQGKAYAVQDGDICFFKFRLPNYRPGGVT